MDSSIQTLPKTTTISSSVLTFLNDKLVTKQDLTQSANLLLELQTRCCDLDRTLIELNRKLQSSLVAYASFSDQIAGHFCNVKAKLTDLESVTCSRSSISDGGGRVEQILGEELPALAKEVARVETVRAYAGQFISLPVKC